jgi:hypothetical protein
MLPTHRGRHFQKPGYLLAFLDLNLSSSIVIISLIKIFENFEYPSYLSMITSLNERSLNLEFGINDFAFDNVIFFILFIKINIFINIIKIILYSNKI